jgi:hypothetical protein
MFLWFTGCLPGALAGPRPQSRSRPLMSPEAVDASYQTLIFGCREVFFSSFFFK